MNHLRQIRIFMLFTVILITMMQCKHDEVSVPKPRMYPRIIFPDRIDTVLSKDFCDFTFTYPNYFTFTQDTLFFDVKPIHPCWFNMHSIDLNSTLHCSYYPISKINSLDKLVNDAFEMTGKHNIKANYRRENIIDNGQNAYGIMFEVDGPVASPLQFYVTDSLKHFFRASLYFDDKVNPDSTKIIYDFIKKDIDQMVNTFQWN